MLPVGFCRLQHIRLGKPLFLVVCIFARLLFQVLHLRDDFLHPSLGSVRLLIELGDAVLLLLLFLGQLFQIVQCLDLGRGDICKPLLFLFYFELGHRQMLFRAAALTALQIRVPGPDHVLVEIVLQDGVGLFQHLLPAGGEHRLAVIVQHLLGVPLLAPADLHDRLFNRSDQSRVLTSL